MVDSDLYLVAEHVMMATAASGKLRVEAGSGYVAFLDS
jgi:hypothetical protein